MVAAAKAVISDGGSLSRARAVSVGLARPYCFEANPAFLTISDGGSFVVLALSIF